MNDNETVTDAVLTDLDLSAVREQLNNPRFSHVSLPRHVVAGMLTLIDESHASQADHDSDAHRKLASIMYLCTRTDGTRGIWKRIDENRELLECLQQNAPELLKEFSWVNNWIGAQDAFLFSLKKLLNLANIPFRGARIPRPWVGKFDSMGLCEHLVETSLKKSGTWLEKTEK